MLRYVVMCVYCRTPVPRTKRKLGAKKHSMLGIIAHRQTGVSSNNESIQQQNDGVMSGEAASPSQHNNLNKQAGQPNQKNIAHNLIKQEKLATDQTKPQSQHTGVPDNNDNNLIKQEKLATDQTKPQSQHTGMPDNNDSMPPQNVGNETASPPQQNKHVGQLNQDKQETLATDQTKPQSQHTGVSDNNDSMSPQNVGSEQTIQEQPVQPDLDTQTQYQLLRTPAHNGIKPIDRQSDMRSFLTL